MMSTNNRSNERGSTASGTSLNLRSKLRLTLKRSKRRFRAMLLGLELHEAAAHNDIDALQEYIRSGKFDINEKDLDWYSRTPLHWACAKGFVDGIRLLLENGAKGTSRAEGGWTPAHCAAEAGKIHALRALHNAHVPIDRKDKHGATPLRIATIYNRVDCMRFLQQAEIEQKERRKKLNIEDNSDDDYD